MVVYSLYEDYRTILTQNRIWLKPTKQRAKNSAAELPKLSEHDPFVGLWQRMIGLLSTVADEFDAQWQQRQRVINALLLMLFILRLVFSKNQQGYATTVVELWAQCRSMGVSLPQSKPVATSVFCNVRKKLDAAIFKTVNTRIIAGYEQSPETYNWLGQRLFVADGMKINLPRPLRDANYAQPSDNSNYPQGLVSCLYQLESQIPYNFELASHMNERRMPLAHCWIPLKGKARFRLLDSVAGERGFLLGKTFGRAAILCQR